MATLKRGRQSFILPQPPAITHWASVVGKKEAAGPLGYSFDIKNEDTYFGQKTWEQAEKFMQQQKCLMHMILFQHYQKDIIQW